jgi:hypothetical protein
MNALEVLTKRISLFLAAFIALTAAGGCRHEMSETSSSSPRRDINAVLADNDKRLLAIPGVVGVYVGLLEDGRTQCLRVMLSRKTREGESTIPRTLEGYPVVTEVTGEIRPFQNP